MGRKMYLNYPLMGRLPGIGSKVADSLEKHFGGNVESASKLTIDNLMEIPEIEMFRAKCVHAFLHSQDRHDYLAWYDEMVRKGYYGKGAPSQFKTAEEIPLKDRVFTSSEVLEDPLIKKVLSIYLGQEVNQLAPHLSHGSYRQYSAMCQHLADDLGANPDDERLKFLYCIFNKIRDIAQRRLCIRKDDRENYRSYIATFVYMMKRKELLKFNFREEEK